MVFGIVSSLLAIVIIGYGETYGQTNTTSLSEKYDNNPYANQSLIDISKNPNFTFFNATSSLPTYWSDPGNSCKKYFSCAIKLTDGWNDYISFGISTINSTQSTWSSIKGSEIFVKPSQRVQLVSHMKLNNWARQSHVALEGFNETSQKWYQITQCPFGSNGPMEWREFSCTIKIPENTSKIKEVLNAGWSSNPKREATTWFDSIDVLGNERAPPG